LASALGSGGVAGDCQALQDVTGGLAGGIVAAVEVLLEDIKGAGGCLARAAGGCEFKVGNCSWTYFGKPGRCFLAGGKSWLVKLLNELGNGFGFRVGLGGQGQLIGLDGGGEEA
jgi:hypothetical protein